MGEIMGTRIGGTGGGRGGFQGNPQTAYMNPPQQEYRTHNQMTYPIIQPMQVQNNNQGTYQAQAFGQNQNLGVSGGQGGQGMAPQPIYQNPGVTGGQGGHGMVPQPIYQLTVQQPGTVVQGEQGNQGGQRTQGPREEQGVQEKAKEILGNLLAQYNN